MKKIKKHFNRVPSAFALSLIFILLHGIALRFMNTPDRYSFDTDSVRDAIVGYEGARTLSFPLVGPFSSTGPYTFGPLYYVSLILFSIISPTIYSPWILMGILSLFTILLMADIGRLLSSKKLGIILAFLTAIAPTQINVATSLSNINPVPFFATLSIWLALKLITKEFSHFFWFFVFGLALGMGINAHYQMVGLLALPAFLWIKLGWKKYTIPLLIFLGLFLTFIPLLVFNLQTNWNTLNGFKEMIIAKERMYIPNSWRIYLFQFWVSHLQFILLSPTLLNLLLVLAFGITCVVDFLKKRLSAGLLMLIITFGANFLWLRYYWGERHDVYLYYLSPILFIFVGYTLFSLLRTKYGMILCGAFLLLIGWNMLATDYTRAIQISEHVGWEKEVQILLKKYPNNNIALYSCDSFYQIHKSTLVYLLRFHYQPEAPEKKIGLVSNDCQYPSTKDYNFKKSRVREKYATIIYPSLFPELQYTTFIDLSPATPSALADAAWRITSTKIIFNGTVNWWKK